MSSPRRKRKRRKYHAEVGDPYAEGADAAWAGRTEGENPYPTDSDDYLTWNDGWNAAKDDRTLNP